MFVTQETIRATHVFNISKPQSHSLMLQRQKNLLKETEVEATEMIFFFIVGARRLKKLNT